MANEKMSKAEAIAEVTRLREENAELRRAIVALEAQRRLDGEAICNAFAWYCNEGGAREAFRDSFSAALRASGELITGGYAATVARVTDA